jgi:hypothetical protein
MCGNETNNISLGREKSKGSFKKGTLSLLWWSGVSTFFLLKPLLLRFVNMHVGRWFCEQGDSLVGQDKLQNVPLNFLLTVQEIKWTVVIWQKQSEHYE